MYCKKCGQELEKEANFCNGCGEQIERKESYIKENTKHKNKTGILKKSIIGIVVAIVVLVVIGMFSDSSDNEYVKIVKNGSFNSYPEIVIGDAFDSFFTNSKWDYFVSDEGENVVEFTGGCEFDGEKVKALIQFKLDEEGGFEATYFSMNNVSQNLLMMSGMIEAVMENYKE